MGSVGGPWQCCYTGVDKGCFKCQNLIQAISWQKLAFLLYISISLARKSSLSHWLSGPSVCHWSCEEKTDRRSISSHHPICRHGLFFYLNPTPNPAPSPNCRTVIALRPTIHNTASLKTWSSTFQSNPPLLSTAFYKKYNPTDPKPDGEALICKQTSAQ